jgi:uncharacterized surface anchored protein
MGFGKSCKAGVVAALALAGVPQGVALPLLAGGMVFAAGEAMAANTIPGVGTVIKKKPGDSAIAKGVSDEKGEVRFEGLEPGDYTVTVGENKPQDFSIKEKGIVVIIVVEGTEHEYVGHVTLLR